MTMLIAPSAALAQSTPPRPTVVVVPFETDRTGWMPPPAFGTTLSELLADRLIESGKYRVMDYTFLVDAGPPPGGRPPFDALSKRAVDARIDYLVVGSVTRYSTEHHRRGGGVAGFVPFIGGAGGTKVETVMSLTVRVIDPRTGEIVTTATPEGVSSRRSVTAGGLAGLGARAALAPVGGALFSSSSSKSREALIDEATQDAIDLAADALVSAVAKLTRSVQPPGRPITRSPDHLIPIARSLDRPITRCRDRGECPVCST
jgi:curli biogenesis system outer membrane secretion channel CsgG